MKNSIREKHITLLTQLKPNTLHIMKILEQITLQQALDWQDTDEKVCYVCDTFGVYAHMTNTIELIESYMEHLLSFES